MPLFVEKCVYVCVGVGGRMIFEFFCVFMDFDRGRVGEGVGGGGRVMRRR